MNPDLTRSKHSSFSVNAIADTIHLIIAEIIDAVKAEGHTGWRKS